MGLESGFCPLILKFKIHKLSSVNFNSIIFINVILICIHIVINSINFLIKQLMCFRIKISDEELLSEKSVNNPCSSCPKCGYYAVNLSQKVTKVFLCYKKTFTQIYCLFCGSPKTNRVEICPPKYKFPNWAETALKQGISNGKLRNVSLDLNNMKINKKKISKIFTNDGLLLKRVRTAAEAEYNFYESLSSTSRDNSPLKVSTIEYFGVIQYKSNKYLILKNLCFGLNQPCYLDIKLGKITTKQFEVQEPKIKLQLSLEKIEKNDKRKLADETSTSVQYGFRIDSYLLIYKTENILTLCMDRIKKDIDKLANLTYPKTISLIRQFIFPSGENNEKLPLHFYITKIQELIDFYNVEMWEYIYRGVSLFLVYDGKDKYDLKLIDFERRESITEGPKTIDSDMIFALNQVINLFKDISNDYNNEV